jgi:hypothetical protein
MKVARVLTVCTVICSTLFFALPASADFAGSVSREDVKDVFKAPGYSPYAGPRRPTASPGARR